MISESEVTLGLSVTIMSSEGIKGDISHLSLKITNFRAQTECNDALQQPGCQPFGVMCSTDRLPFNVITSVMVIGGMSPCSLTRMFLKPRDKFRALCAYSNTVTIAPDKDVMSDLDNKHLKQLKLVNFCKYLHERN